MSSTPTFRNPPIVELAIGVQFERLPMQSGYFGMFWQHMGEEWGKPFDNIPLEEQFERFDQPRWMFPLGQLKLEPAQPTLRFMLPNKDGNRLIQLQANRLHLNWRKQGQEYPSYKQLVGEFEEVFDRLVNFAEIHGLGPVEVNQWELSYIDSFPQGQYWHTPADWPKFLPGLFGGLFPADQMGLKLEHRAAEWSFEITPQRGRLHIATQYGPPGTGQAGSLILQMTARGPAPTPDGAGLRTGLDWGHDAAVGAFLKIVNPSVQEEWGVA